MQIFTKPGGQLHLASLLDRGLRGCVDGVVQNLLHVAALHIPAHEVTPDQGRLIVGPRDLAALYPPEQWVVIERAVSVALETENGARTVVRAIAVHKWYDQVERAVGGDERATLHVIERTVLGMVAATASLELEHADASGLVRYPLDCGTSGGHRAAATRSSHRRKEDTTRIRTPVAAR